MKDVLTFLNHASFLIETEKSFLLIDPWYKGSAFNNGWSLLDQSINDLSIIQRLSNKTKSVNVWYSHEHSDHLSFPFLKLLQESKLNPTIFFHYTQDKRVIRTLEKMHFQVIEQKQGSEYYLDENLSLTTWSHANYLDSYSLIKVNGISILNLNDCVIRDKKECLLIKDEIQRVTSEINVLFTQFGYANWISNLDNPSLREEKANEKNLRINIQNKFLEPEIIIPFASFIYFSHDENFFLNDNQNTPNKLRESPLLKEINDKIFFLKPYDKFTINEKLKPQVSKLTYEAEMYWNRLFVNIKPEISQINYYKLEEIDKAFKKYRRSISLKLLFLPQILETIGFIQPINIYASDIEQVLCFSWLKSIEIKTENIKTHISLSTESLLFTVSTDYGLDALTINGRFHEDQDSGLYKVERFLLFQKYIQKGYTISRPLIFFRKIITNTLSQLRTRI